VNSPSRCRTTEGVTCIDLLAILRGDWANGLGIDMSPWILDAEPGTPAVNCAPGTAGCYNVPMAPSWWYNFAHPTQEQCTTLRKDSEKWAYGMAAGAALMLRSLYTPSPWGLALGVGLTGGTSVGFMVTESYVIPFCP